MKTTIQFEPELSNFLDESFSNATDTVSAVAEGVGALANAAVAFKPRGENNTTKKEAQALKIAIKAQCGRKRMLLGKKKYSQCAKEVADKASQQLALEKSEERKLKLEQIKSSSENEERKLKSEQIKAQTDELRADVEKQRLKSEEKKESDNKILGMPKPVFFIGLAAIAISGFFFIKYKNNMNYI